MPNMNGRPTVKGTNTKKKIPLSDVLFLNTFLSARGNMLTYLAVNVPVFNTVSQTHKLYVERAVPYFGRLVKMYSKVIYSGIEVYQKFEFEVGMCMHAKKKKDQKIAYMMKSVNMIDYPQMRKFQVVQDGYEFFANRHLVTIFSAPFYCGQFDNAGGMMRIDESLKCHFIIRRPKDHKWRKKAPKSVLE